MNPDPNGSNSRSTSPVAPLSTITVPDIPGPDPTARSGVPSAS